MTLSLADGLDAYVALVRAQPPAPDVETSRLTSDMTAANFAADHRFAVERYDSYIAAPGREIAVRIFDPGGEGARPGFCYYHGGGFAYGSVESFDIVGAALAEAAGAVVVSVQYRRLPEARYADAEDDCIAAFEWTVRQAETLRIDPARVGVAGDSAGALLALATAAALRHAGGRQAAAMLLFYGTYTMDTGRPAHAESRDPLLTAERVRGYIDLFRRSGGLDAHPAPIDRTDLAGLPPAHIVAAEHDPLCAEAEEMAARLDGAGVPVALRIAPGMIHGFLRATGVSAAARDELSAAATAAVAMMKDQPE